MQARVAGALAHDVPLVVPREDDRPVVGLGEDEVVEQLEPRIALPDPLPEVRRRVPVAVVQRIHRFSSWIVSSKVNGPRTAIEALPAREAA